MINGFCGQENEIENIINGRPERVYDNHQLAKLNGISSAWTIALHMHQPLIPAGGWDLRTADVISNLEHMRNNPGIGDNHNWSTFKWCYQRMGEFIPSLIHQGKEPRIMLEYSGSLLLGLQKMGEWDVINSLKNITTNNSYKHCVEWLGCPWGHAVAPSTPPKDFRLHVKAWQHYFASIFGAEALQRVRGFSPSEMALPNNPDVAYEYVKTLKDCGYLWVLIQEHTVELLTGRSLEQKHLPHRLVCTNSKGETVSIIALIKTQGSDTKLVAQMQPYYEAKTLSHWKLGERSIPPVVSQIADGENGGVMMNEFPPGYFNGVQESSHSNVRLVNGTEYLEYLFSLGITEEDFEVCQPIHQHKIWEQITPGEGIEKTLQVMEELKKSDGRIHFDGGSWTDDISWVNGYDDVLGPMQEASVAFNSRNWQSTSDPKYADALFNLMNCQTSCFRYWGQGIWCDYGREFSRRAIESSRK
jgi:hypothetical protein